jgi:hypothetical protein
MRMLTNPGLTAAALAAGFAAVPMTEAQAKIACVDGFQRVQGSMISTPYCQDALLGRVARQYGFRVSDRQIRNNPNTKIHICRFVGHDIRVRFNCVDSLPSRGRFF